jgi:cytochrome c peroxidase
MNSRGPDPPAAILDAMVAYVEDIEFLPNPQVSAGGRLSAKSGAAARRGEQLFVRAFPHDPALSCAACHIPSDHFVDHHEHDVGTGGAFKTPTLVNADFNAPYFHDGRFSTYDEVVSYFDRQYSPGFSAANRSDMAAYLSAIGNSERGEEQDSIEAWLKEINDFAGVLATAIPAHDNQVVSQP